ncbi:MAG: ABC transporter ATP-binding protein [Tissierellia bacterium]|nr:ABC transporter ATP-binding protein [Tissierellia bacterium]
MIEAKSVSLVYENGTVALRDVSLHIKPGEIVYITGPSGSGKTSFLKLLMGIEYPTTGRLKVMGQTMSRMNASNIRRLRQKMGPVFQEFKLIRGRTALENVMLGMRFLGFPPKKMQEYAMEALTNVGLEHKSSSLVERLSWGESQRVAIARAIARRPSLILADEPTGNLDVDNAMNIMDLLTSFRDENTSVIITTHATHLIEDKEEGTFIRIKNGNLQIERRGEALV